MDRVRVVTFIKQNTEWVALAIILLLATYMRTGSPGIVEFKRDEANLSLLALDVANGVNFPLLGIGSSVGLPNAPVNVYILAIPYLFDSNPQVATQFVGLLNILAIGITYFFAKRYIGVFPALVMILIFALNPWAIIFSRKIWAQNMLLPFIVLTMFIGILGFIENKRWAQFVHLPLLVITGQIHYGTFVMIPVSMYLIGYKWHKTRKFLQPLALSGLVAILLIIPFAVGMFKAGFDNLTEIRAALNTSDAETSLQLTSKAFHGAALMLAGTEIHSLAGPVKFQQYLNMIPSWLYTYWGILVWGVSGGTIWLFVKIVRFKDKRTPIEIALLIWFFSPIILFSLSWTPFYIHYLIPIFPAAYLILAFAGVDFAKAITHTTARRVLLPFGIAILCSILISQGWAWSKLLIFLDNEYTPEGFGTPIHYLNDIRDAILDRKPNDVVAWVGGQTLVIDDNPTIWKALLYDVPSLRFEDDVTMVYPEVDAVYLINECNAQTSVFLLRDLDEGCYSITNRAQEDLSWSQFKKVPEDTGIFSNGVEVVGYKWETIENACLSLVWRIHQAASENYQFAVHFYQNGIETSQADGLSWQSYYWKLGDIVVRQFCIDDEFTDADEVRIGMYQYDGVQFYNVNLMNGNNAPAGQLLSLPLE